MTRAAFGLAAVACGVLACQGDRSVTAGPAHFAGAMSDGANSAPGFPSNPHFFFLPPTAASPSPTGTFNPRLSPVVQICSQSVTPCPADQVHAVFTTTSGPGSETVRLDATNQQYIVNWDTDPTTEPVGAGFRIAVLVRQEVLGFADVIMAAPGVMENAATTTDIALLDNRTLPIKFLVEDGALCP